MNHRWNLILVKNEGEGVSQDQLSFTDILFLGKRWAFLSQENIPGRLAIRETARVSLYPAPTSAKQCKYVKAVDREADTVGQRPWNPLLTANIQSQTTFQRTSMRRVICNIANSDNMMPVGNV